jgi:hypothetical protein
VSRPTPHAAAAAPAVPAERPPIALFVEGARDREILQSWARRVSVQFSRMLSEATVILGGRQPARAASHLARLRESERPALALCVLDRDDVPYDAGEALRAAQVETFTWQRRHIESYLLVPAAIRRAFGAADRRGRLPRLLREHLPAPDDERALCDVDAKRLLGPQGPIARAMGRRLDLGRIARCTDDQELHTDVHTLLGRLRDAVDAAARPAPQVQFRRAGGNR